MDLSTVTAVVTGGASGLGEATVRLFASRGARAVIIDLPGQPGAAIVDSLGDCALFTPADVTSEEQVAAAVDQAVARFGAIHVLVNCAGIATAGKTVGSDGKPANLAQFRRTVEINLVGSYNVACQVAARMVKNDPNEGLERGVIIHTASVAATEGQIGQTAYSASKGGVVGMTLPMARDLARDGVRVCTIAPGLFLTPMMMGLPEAARAALGSATPFPPRLGQPAEYAALAAHIVENSMLNGETIRLDGAIRLAPR